MTLTGWKVDITDDGEDNPVDYCPLVITVNGIPYSGTASEIEAAVEDAINDYGVKEYAVGATIGDHLEVSWAWAFEVDDATNVKDTALGDAAAAGSASTISLNVTCTVDQIETL